MLDHEFGTAPVVRTLGNHLPKRNLESPIEKLPLRWGCRLNTKHIAEVKMGAAVLGKGECEGHGLHGLGREIRRKDDPPESQRTISNEFGFRANGQYGALGAANQMLRT